MRNRRFGMFLEFNHRDFVYSDRRDGEFHEMPGDSERHFKLLCMFGACKRNALDGFAVRDADSDFDIADRSVGPVVYEVNETPSGLGGELGAKSFGSFHGKRKSVAEDFSYRSYECFPSG